MVPLDAVLITPELGKRPSRLSDRGAEIHALLALTQVLARSPGQILPALVDTALSLCSGESAGISLLDEQSGPTRIRWHAVAGHWADLRGNTSPRDASPCGTVLDRNTTLLFSLPHRHFTDLDLLQPLSSEALLAPIRVGERAIGTLWVVAHDERHQFDCEDQRILETLATFAAAAHENVESLRVSEIRSGAVPADEAESGPPDALTAAEEIRTRLAAIVESSDDAIVSKDLSGRITSWNRGAERLFGYTADEMIGQSVTRIIPADRLHEEDTILGRLKRGERIDHFETTRVRKDGTSLAISLTVSPIKDALGRIIGASKTARDITIQKRAEEELRAADRRKSEFLAILAHELRNPLAPIRNALQVLRLVLNESNVERAALEILERQVGHVVRLVDDLLDLSRISRGHIELRKKTVELVSVVSDALEAVRPFTEEMNHELTVTLAPQRTYVTADPLRLAQVLSNLLSNACKFTEANGRIRLTVDRESTQAIIRVQDSGIGIPAEHIPHIFEMFTQVDPSLERARGGLGIGLTLVKYLVEAHGGTVEAHSAGPGQGSEFIVRLPVLVEPQPPVLQDPSDDKLLATARRRILVVDDNRDATETLAKVLELSGHEVYTAHDGIEAVAEARRLQPDVVLLDIGLPKLNGYDAARRIREQDGEGGVLLVALTGWGQPEDRRQAQEAGFDAHMVKPVNHADLAKLLHAAPARSSLSPLGVMGATGASRSRRLRGGLPSGQPGARQPLADPPPRAR
jgi:PAS domain S-box-containing protein